MVQRKKRATASTGKSTARGKVRTGSKSARKKAAKKAMPTKLKPKQAGAKKVARKKVRPKKPPVEAIIADTVEEPVPSVITITEIEETEVREEGEGAKTPEHPESEER
jgi:hypothetical protein